MATQLLSEKMNDGLNKLVQRLFWGNRLLDRMMSVLSIKFVMNKTSGTLHPILAHSFPLMADVISDYQDYRNCMTVYLDTPTNGTDYKDPLELFTTFLDYMTELEKLIHDTIDMAEKEKDRTTKVFLEQFLNLIIPYTGQALLLHDKAEAYGEDWMDFDRDIENFLLVKQFVGPH